MREHLYRAFPTPVKKEICRLEKRYYRNLADVTVEVVKGMAISELNLEAGDLQKTMI